MGITGEEHRQINSIIKEIMSVIKFSKINNPVQ
jgi:hypothetical protein